MTVSKMPKAENNRLFYTFIYCFKQNFIGLFLEFLNVYPNIT